MCYFLFLYIGGFLPCLIVIVLRLVFSKSIFADTRLRKISFSTGSGHLMDFEVMFFLVVG